MQTKLIKIKKDMISKNIGETEKIAKTLLDKILKSKKKQRGALVVCLSGDLGTGKTAFTKSIAKHLGIKDKIFSPTYVIFKKYPIKLDRYKFFFHMDAYRLESEKELLNIGWEEIIGNENNIVFIEWPEKIAKSIPADSKFIYISSNDKEHRNFKF